MSTRRMRVERAMELLPDTDDLIPLRGTVAEAARPDDSLAWSGAEAYETFDTLLFDVDSLEAAIPEVVERVRVRVEVVYRRVAAALRALAAGDEAVAARALVEAGEAEEGAGRLDSAEAFYRRAAELGRRPRDRTAEGLALRRLGRVARARGALDEALRQYRGGFEIAEASLDAEGMVVGCQGMGNVHADRGEWKKAIRWFERGLEWVVEAPSRGRWQLEVNLSNVCRRADLLTESGVWLGKAEQTVESLDDAGGRVYLLNSSGLLRLAAGDAAGAVESYREALRACGGPGERATVLINLAESLILLGGLVEAEAAVRDLERTALAYRLIGYLPHAYRLLGSIARERRDADGFVFYEQALALCDQEAMPELERALAQEEYGTFEAALGNRESAVARLESAGESFSRLGSAPDVERVEREIMRLGSHQDGSINEADEGGEG